jgi:hypothetical protein
MSQRASVSSSGWSSKMPKKRIKPQMATVLLKYVDGREETKKLLQSEVADVLKYKTVAFIKTGSLLLDDTVIYREATVHVMNASA